MAPGRNKKAKGRLALMLSNGSPRVSLLSESEFWGGVRRKKSGPADGFMGLAGCLLLNRRYQKIKNTELTLSIFPVRPVQDPNREGAWVVLVPSRYYAFTERRPPANT